MEPDDARRKARSSKEVQEGSCFEAGGGLQRSHRDGLGQGFGGSFEAQSIAGWHAAREEDSF